MADARRPSFGIMTAPSRVDYQDLLRVWREADEIPRIEHALRPPDADLRRPGRPDV